MPVLHLNIAIVLRRCITRSGLPRLVASHLQSGDPVTRLLLHLFLRKSLFIRRLGVITEKYLLRLQKGHQIAAQTLGAAPRHCRHAVNRSAPAYRLHDPVTRLGKRGLVHQVGFIEY